MKSIADEVSTLPDLQETLLDFYTERAVVAQREKVASGVVEILSDKPILSRSPRFVRYLGNMAANRMVKEFDVANLPTEIDPRLPNIGFMSALPDQTEHSLDFLEGNIKTFAKDAAVLGRHSEIYKLIDQPVVYFFTHIDCLGDQAAGAGLIVKAGLAKPENITSLDGKLISSLTPANLWTGEVDLPLTVQLGVTNVSLINPDTKTSDSLWLRNVSGVNEQQITEREAALRALNAPGMKEIERATRQNPHKAPQKILISPTGSRAILHDNSTCEMPEVKKPILEYCAKFLSKGMNIVVVGYSIDDRRLYSTPRFGKIAGHYISFGRQAPELHLSEPIRPPEIKVTGYRKNGKPIEGRFTPEEFQDAQAQIKNYLLQAATAVTGRPAYFATSEVL